MMSIHSLPEAWRAVKAVLGLSLRKNKVVLVTVLLVMMVTLPLVLLLMSTSTGSTYLADAFQSLVTFLTLQISLAALILSAGLMFAYLHNRPAIDVFHALPVRRVPLFIGRFRSWPCVSCQI
jgi:uncharacterized BrkB/YihY/UPF0761 family membrane protein